jgi:uroporphyrinogen-III synthase
MADGRRVLVTRPEPGASETARRLEELGLLPIKLPLQETLALPVEDAAVPDGATAVAITSANAIRYTPPALLAKLAGFPCFVVGASSARAARAAGFTNVIEGQGDAESLADTVIAKRPAEPVVYLCGRVRRPHFEQRLAGAGIAVTAVETYDTSTVIRTTDEVAAAIGEAPVDYVLVYSANSAEALVTTTSQPVLAGLFKTTMFACISARVADVLAGKVSGKILVAGEPRETALLALLHETADRAS